MQFMLGIQLRNLVNWQLIYVIEIERSIYSINKNMENDNRTLKKYRHSVVPQRIRMISTAIEQESTFSKDTTLQSQNRKNILRNTDTSAFKPRQFIQTDHINERASYNRENPSESENLKQKQFNKKQNESPNSKPKGVRFRERISIQNIDVNVKYQNPLNDFSNEEKISMLHNIFKNKNFKISMTSRRRASETIKIVTNLMNSPVQSKSSVIEEMRCFMCHYPEQNSQIFSKRVILIVKEKLRILGEEEANESLFFRYELFGYFLKSFCNMNYDSLEVINSFESMLNKYNYPTSIKIMLYYLGNHLYQVNNLYYKSQEILGRLLSEVITFKLYELMGVYLFLMSKLKANLLQWESCVILLMKLLAYAWLYNMDNLQVWIYFQLSRSYFFLNHLQHSQYFKTRSEMSILEPNHSVYRQLIAKQWKIQMDQMRQFHRPLNLNKIINISELIKLKQPSKTINKSKDSFKLQSQIKRINEQCKIKYVKNLIIRINSTQCKATNTSKNLNSSQQKFDNPPKFVKNFAGNPLLRTHQSGLKNLKIYFRSNPKRQSFMNKNRQPKLYTLQNSNKNILVLKQLSRNILLEMKWFLPINQC